MFLVYIRNMERLYFQWVKNPTAHVKPHSKR